MALVAAKSCLTRLGSLTGPNGSIINSARIVAGVPFRIQVATLKATYGEKYPYSKPFPYLEKKYAGFNELFDPTIARYNENTKVIIVEGNVAVGKNDFAKRLAHNFDLKYIPSVDDSACFQYNGYDMRGLNEMLPEDVSFYDLADFYKDPNPERGYIGRLQHLWYYERFLTYARGLLHVLSTGQGVVMARTALSDMVYGEVLRKFGYVSPNYFKYYDAIFKNSVCELLPPHVVMYLDAPVDAIKQRIKARNDPREVNSKLLSDNYLQAIENEYKQKFLPHYRRNCEVLEIDWSEPADDMDMEAIAEEMEELVLEPEDNEDPKFHEWGNKVDDEWIHLRKVYEDEITLYGILNLVAPPLNIPEVTGHNDEIFREAVLRNPIFKYTKGWAPELGKNPYVRWN